MPKVSMFFPEIPSESKPTTLTLTHFTKIDHIMLKKMILIQRRSQITKKVDLKNITLERRDKTEVVVSNITVQVIKIMTNITVLEIPTNIKIMIIIKKSKLKLYLRKLMNKPLIHSTKTQKNFIVNLQLSFCNLNVSRNFLKDLLLEKL